MSRQAARIKIRRLGRPLGAFLRSYNVLVDDRVVGTIGFRQTRTFEVSPGPHRVSLALDWKGSRRVDFDLSPGEEAELVCSARPSFRIDPNRRHEYILLDIAKAPERPVPPPPPLPPGAPTDDDLQAAWKARAETAEQVRELRVALQKAIDGDFPLEARRLRKHVNGVVAEHERTAAEFDRLWSRRPDWKIPD